MRYPIIWIEKVSVVKLSQKLDLLQALARQYADDPNSLYLIRLLAEHADDEEETELFLEKMRAILPYLSR